jgi:hypothetical protein
MAPGARERTRVPPLSMVPESFTGEPAFPFGEGPTSDEKGPTFQRVPDPGGTGA